MNDSMNFTIEDNSQEILSAMEKQVLTALQLVGEEAIGYAKGDCPVDTGRLRNSITYATSQDSGGGDSSPQATPEKYSVYIGTNVEYAAVQEYKDLQHKTGKAHFLKDAATTHGSRYKEIVEAALKQD